MESNRSTFVTVIAWLFIVGSGFATLLFAMQNIMFHYMFQNDEPPELPSHMPAGVAFLFENFQWFLLGILLLSIALLISSIGLLKRKNWARLVFVSLMALTVVWQVGILILQVMVFADISAMSAMPEMSELPRSPEYQDIHVMQSVMMAFFVLIGLGIAGFFAWIIKRLISAPVRHEFKS